MPTTESIHFRHGMFPPDLPANAAPAGTKGRILESALVAFAERGFHGTSIRTIADGASINSATLYSHFASKEHILSELVSIGSHELLARLQADLVDVTGSAARLDAIVAATVRAHASFPLLAVVTNGEFSALSRDLAGPAVAPTAEASELLRVTLEEGITDGTFDVPNLRVTARLIEGMAQQIPHWLTPADDPEELVREYVVLARRIAGNA